MLFNFIVSCITMTTKGDSAKEKRVMQNGGERPFTPWSGRAAVRCSSVRPCQLVFAKKKMFYLPFAPTRVHENALGKDKDACKRGFFFPEKEADV